MSFHPNKGWVEKQTAYLHATTTHSGHVQLLISVGFVACGLNKKMSISLWTIRGTSKVLDSAFSHFFFQKTTTHFVGCVSLHIPVYPSKTLIYPHILIFRHSSQTNHILSNIRHVKDIVLIIRSTWFQSHSLYPQYPANDMDHYISPTTAPLGISVNKKAWLVQST